MPPSVTAHPGYEAANKPAGTSSEGLQAGGQLKELQHLLRGGEIPPRGCSAPVFANFAGSRAHRARGRAVWGRWGKLPLSSCFSGEKRRKARAKERKKTLFQVIVQKSGRLRTSREEVAEGRDFILG